VIGTVFKVFLLFNILPVENIISKVNSAWLHVRSVDPNPAFYEMDHQFLVLFELNGEPGIRKNINLINELE
jgi:hypothetical protein